ncbi:PDZ domain-containing protein [bacterium]|nr:PDZ domain-containing protein [bacterium]
MKNVIDQIWKSVNIILMVLIVASVGYVYFLNPGQMFGARGGMFAEEPDVHINDVIMNSNQPQTIGWGEGFIQGQPVANDPNGLQQIATMDNDASFIHNPDPYGIQMIARTELTPPSTQTGALDKILQEGHWIGLEVVPLTAAIALANGVPENVTGVLVDEVTLVSAESGLLAGDVITAIDSQKVTNLRSFKAATALVQALNQSMVTVYRNGNYQDIAVNNGEQLGLAQMEAAPMILPTDASPHGYYGPCDRCHTISKTAKNTGQMKKDAGDILTVTAHPIKWGSESRHRNRGTCTNCHNVI